jgi:hypothetical protein
MTSIDSESFPKVLTLYLELSQYPILAPIIRERMREMLFERNIISPEAFETEAQQKAKQSQRREGLYDPHSQEPSEAWQQRLRIVRDNLTDFYFAYNLPHELFEDLVRSVLEERIPSKEVVLTFHPELAPWDMLFAQGEAYENLPPEERERVKHDLQEIKVVLIKSMISDHLEYLGIAKEWFDIADLKEIRRRRIGRGKIGGKAAGIKLAESVLRKKASPELLGDLSVPESWFVGADVFYRFTQVNGLLAYANQKYKTKDEIRQDYPTIRDSFRRGRFPEEFIDNLRSILDQTKGIPLIVRSSSLLEDSFGTSFAGKYESHFCPNQGADKENLGDLVAAISRVYASVYSPDVLLYRRRMGLIDYDERMAILIQQVVGSQHGRYFLPSAAGVAFSRNQFRWSPRIDRKAGFLRMVWGLGTRAVDTVAGDYPRLVALSHPELRPETSPQAIRRYSQSKVDVIDLEKNEFLTLPVNQVISGHLPHLRWIGQHYQQGSLQDFVSRPLNLNPKEVVITFHELLRKTPFPKLMRDMLATLEQAYKTPVDTEFAIILTDEGTNEPGVNIGLVQCRPQSQLITQRAKLPSNIPPERKVFTIDRVVPNGRVSNVRYLVYVQPQGYNRLPVGPIRRELAGVVSNLNQKLEGETFFLMGPGRWGSSNTELGIPITYADIYNSSALIELFEGDEAPEPSYGTHFFQDLVEAKIFPLALAIDGPEDSFNRRLFEQSANSLTALLPEAAEWSDVIRLIDLEAIGPGERLQLVMDNDADQAVAYLTSTPEDVA